MDKWEGGNVPGIACERERFESPDVVGEVVDDHFYNFTGKGVGAFGGRCAWSLVVQYASNPGFAAVPDDASEEVQPFAV